MNSRHLDVQSHFIHSHRKDKNINVRPKELDINNRTNNGSSFSFNKSKDNDGETSNSILRGGTRNLALIDPSPVHKNYKRSSSK